MQAGIDSIALILANTAGAIISGAVTNKTGHYAHWFIVSSVIMSIGAGCLTLFTVDIAKSKWIGFLFLYGIGVGFGFQQGAVAVQAVLPMAQVPIGTALIWFVQMLGGALFTSVAQNIFSTHLAENLANLQLPGLDPEAIFVHISSRSGSSETRSHLPSCKGARGPRACPEKERCLFLFNSCQTASALPRSTAGPLF